MRRYTFFQNVEINMREGFGGPAGVVSETLVVVASDMLEVDSSARVRCGSRRGSRGNWYKVVGFREQ